MDIFHFICFNLIITVGNIVRRNHILSKPDSLQKTWSNPSNLVANCYLIHLFFIGTTIILLLIHIVMFVVWISTKTFLFLPLIFN